MDDLVDGARRRFTAPVTLLVAVACAAAALTLTPSAADDRPWHVTAKTGDTSSHARDGMSTGNGGTGPVLAVRRPASGAVPRQSGPIGLTGGDFDQVTLALFGEGTDPATSADDEIVLVDFDGRILGTGPGVAWYPHHPQDGVELRVDELGIATLMQAPTVAESAATLPAERVAEVGHWRFALPSPDGRWILAQWSAECEVPVAYLLEVDTGRLEPVFDEGSFSHAIGWTPDGHAVVGTEHAECGGTVAEPGTYVIDPARRTRRYLHPYGRGALVVSKSGPCCRNL